MGYKQTIRKIAKLILASQPETFTKVEVAQINYGGILSGKKIVITGGGRGLGFYMAKKCISEGAEVVISGRKKETLQKAAKELGAKCYPIVYDVTDVEHCTEFLNEAKSVLGGALTTWLAMRDCRCTKITFQMSLSRALIDSLTQISEAGTS